MKRALSQDFFGSKLRLARVFHGWTQIELASKLDLSKFYIAHLEAGQKMPTDLVVNAVSHLTGFAPGFFFSDIVDEFRPEECHLRGRKTTPVNVLNRVLSHGTVASSVLTYLNGRVRLGKASNIPVLDGVPRTMEEVERFAERCRLHWELGLDAPISNMVRVLEQRAGVLVINMSYDRCADKIDAFSRIGRFYTAIINTDRGCASRWRFNLAHELGHLAMHVGLETGDPLLEDQADAFASAFLLPRVGFLRDCPRMRSHIDWSLLFGLKARWKTSVSAIIRRARQFELIDPVLYQRAYRYINKMGWHRNEPYEFAPEKPEDIALAFESLSAVGETTYDVASHIGLSDKNFESVMGLPCVPPADMQPQAEIIQLSHFRRPA